VQVVKPMIHTTSLKTEGGDNDMTVVLPHHTRNLRLGLLLRRMKPEDYAMINGQRMSEMNHPSNGVRLDPRRTNDVEIEILGGVNKDVKMDARTVERGTPQPGEVTLVGNRADQQTKVRTKRNPRVKVLRVTTITTLQ